MTTHEISEARGNFGERKTSGLKDFGYYAHLSIYAFGAQFAKDRRFLDVGSGTGYGTNYILQNAGASSVQGLERDAALIAELNVAYPGVKFHACDLDEGTLPIPDKSVDVAFSSNVLEHLAYVDPVLAEFTRVLTPEGVAIIAIPPIGTVGMLKENAKNIFHINNLPHEVWDSKLKRFFGKVYAYRHWVVPQKTDGLTLATDEILSVDDFVFPLCRSPEDHWATITAIYVCHEPRVQHLGAETEAPIPAEWRTRRIEAEGRQEAFVELQRRLDETDSFWREQTAKALTMGLRDGDATDRLNELLQLLQSLSKKG
jgi:SAM-dependent methyltransferase